MPQSGFTLIGPTLLQLRMPAMSGCAAGQERLPRREAGGAEQGPSLRCSKPWLRLVGAPGSPHKHVEVPPEGARHAAAVLGFSRERWRTAGGGRLRERHPAIQLAKLSC